MMVGGRCFELGACRLGACFRVEKLNFVLPVLVRYAAVSEPTQHITSFYVFH
jgi:hypothetical protein